MKQYIVDHDGDPDKPYQQLEAIHCKTRYGKEVYVEVGYRSDGATGAWDIISNAWMIHDKLCDTGTFKDGSKCSNLQASTVLSDVLRKEGYWIRARYWFAFTLALGGGKARANGMFKVKK